MVETIDINGTEVYTYEYIEHLRQLDSKKRNPYKIVSQRGGQENILKSDADIRIVGGSRGGPLFVDTKVVTPFGYRRIGDIKAGDIISSTDGGMQRVIYRQDHGKLPAYKLTFIDGSTVIASYDHLWNVRKTCYRSKKRILNNLGLEDDWRVWTTQMIVDRLQKKKDGSIKNGHILIPLCKPVQFTRSFGGWYKPKTDPYIIGLILGDGCITEKATKSYACHFTTKEDELRDAFANAGMSIQKTKNHNYDYLVKDDQLKEDLIGLKLIGHNSSTKFIPNIYKYGSIDTRLSILQGLMDTDGTIDQRGHCSYTTISKQLADDVKFIVNSLGGLATINKIPTHYINNGERIDCDGAYQIYIRLEDSSRLFRLERKKSLSKVYNGGISEYARRIIDYEYLGEMECCCIAVDNANSLFMVEDFIVTHNSKSYSLLLETLKDINSKDFKSVIFRKEIDDLSDLIDTSNNIYQDFGTYNRSKADMSWNFNSGASLKFNYYSDKYDDFKVRMQGKQFAYIGIDEITHMEYPKFKYLITNNRNAFSLRNRMVGSCNPDPDSWVAKFIDWWIGEDGLPVPERNGVVRYCFMDGDNVNDVYWGDSKEEVYQQCKSIIDKYWLDSYWQYGSPADLFVKSVAFIEAKLEDNKQLLRSDPTYLANLAGQSEEQRSRDLEGNWKFKTVGDDMIKMPHMEAFYSNSEQIDDGVRRASLDAAFDGGDNLVMWLWVGWHIKDVFVCRKDSQDTVNVVRAKLKEWGVLEENFTYDLNGIGQTFKGFFRSAIPFNNRESVAPEDKGLYDTIKSQAAYLFAKKIIGKEVSIEPYLLDLRFNVGKNKSVPLRQILMNERKAIKANTLASDKGFSLIVKKDMKKLVGHSPDFIEAMFMRMIFEIKKKKGGRPKWNMRYVNPYRIN